MGGFTKANTQLCLTCNGFVCLLVSRLSQSFLYIFLLLLGCDSGKFISSGALLLETRKLAPSMTPGKLILQRKSCVLTSILSLRSNSKKRCIPGQACHPWVSGSVASHPQAHPCLSVGRSWGRPQALSTLQCLFVEMLGLEDSKGRRRGKGKSQAF